METYQGPLHAHGQVQLLDFTKSLLTAFPHFRVGAMRVLTFSNLLALVMLFHKGNPESKGKENMELQRAA